MKPLIIVKVQLMLPAIPKSDSWSNNTYF